MALWGRLGRKDLLKVSDLSLFKVKGEVFKNSHKLLPVFKGHKSGKLVKSAQFPQSIIYKLAT